MNRVEVSVVAEKNESVRSCSGTGHNVQFYENESFLCSALTEFIAAGASFGNPTVLITTTEHRDKVIESLEIQGLNIEALLRTRQVTWLDAQETLRIFMREGQPDEESFKINIGKVIEEARSGREHLTIRLFGEMVDLLAKSGNLEGAVRLEQLWNDLGKDYGFSLLCAYNMGSFYREAQWKFFDRICEQHTHISQEEQRIRAAS